jgi:antiviral helicase SKI2
MAAVVDLDELALLLRDTSLRDPVDVNAQLKSQFLTPSNVLPWDLLDVVQEVPQTDKTGLYDSLVQLSPFISRSQFRLQRRGINGEVVGYEEKLNNADLISSQAANSISLKRQYAANEKSFSGNTSNLPFQPGGSLSVNGKSLQKSLLHRDDAGLFDVAQGLSRSLQIGGDNAQHALNEDIEELEQETEGEELDDIEAVISSEDGIFIEDIVGSSSVLPASSASGFEREIDELLPVDINFGRSLYKEDYALAGKQKDWAVVVDLDHKIENFKEMIPNMARDWPFELDTFQQEAIYHLEKGDSVFVAAHTSAGKTVIAEYAIAMANRNMTKTIYTSPIKALSNQKFRDFKQTFKEVDVGLITGDVQINPEANCLIMTTEILRSMLYRGADLIRDVEFVVFDEVHYVNDIDRGVVWEEVIIMLPDHVKFILLSATVPNTFEFANWIGRTKHKNIYVISTPKRPVPLEISVWGKSKLTKIINADRTFLEKNFNDYLDLYESKKLSEPGNGSSRGSRGGGSNSRGGRGGSNNNSRGGRGGSNASSRGGANNNSSRGRGGASSGPSRRRFDQVSRPNKNTWIELVHFLNSNTLLPAVIFVFSKKRCEEYAGTLQGIDFCNAKEKSQIHMFIDKAVSRLKKEDRELPQIIAVRDLLSRGIAVHHGGLLPIVKEVIEILFAKTLVKVLFATETFAMGLNLPTRTVVFSEIRKHDGTQFRNLLPGEFTQMSGRAGRRGLDPTGTVIIMSYTEALSKTTLKDVMLGTPTKLVSQFRLTYNMILNLLRIEALRVEEMIKHSFGENTSQTLLPEHEKKITELAEKLDALPALQLSDDIKEEELTDIFDKLLRYKELTTNIIKEYLSHAVLWKRFRSGRLIIFKDAKKVTRIGFIVKQTKLSSPTDVKFVALTFNMGREAELAKPTGLPYISRLRPYYKKNFPTISYEGGLKVVEVSIDDIELVSRASVQVEMNKVIQSDAEEIKKFKKQLDLLLRFQSVLDEIDNTGFSTIKLHEALTERQEIVDAISKSSILQSPNFKDAYRNLYEKHETQTKINELKLLMSEENLRLLPDYEQRLEVLKSLGFVDRNLNVVVKGRVACEINCGWELVLTELVLNNFLGDFESEEIVALLSAFVYEGSNSNETEPVITPRLEKGQKKINEIIEKLFKVYDEFQVELTSEETSFFERKRFALVNVVYEWARGLSFKEIMELSVEAEGTIVRVITRLDEICREVRSAALIIGDSALHAKMTHAQELIKRDIVFCASLYL